MMRRLSAAVAGCYAAVQFHLFKPSDVLGPFLEYVGGNPAYVDAEYEVWFTGMPSVMEMLEMHKRNPTFPHNMGETR